MTTLRTSENRHSRRHSTSKRRKGDGLVFATTLAERGPSGQHDPVVLLNADPEAKAAFAAMPAAQRRAYLEFVDEARRPETRARRMQQALRMMTQWAIERLRVGRKRR